MPERYARHLLSFIAEAGIEIGSAPRVPETSEQVIAESELPIVKLIDQVITYWGFLDEWRIHYFERFDFNDNDDFEIQVNLQYDCIRLALAHVEQELLDELEVDMQRFGRFRGNSMNEARINVHEFCAALTQRGLTVRQDYFAFLSTDPRDLYYDMSMEDCQEILCYLSYGERLILERIECLQQSITAINSRLEASSSGKF